MFERDELTGWERIAGHLGVSVRTAQVYEREQGLPVHRLPGQKGRVWAIAEELDAWKRSLPLSGASAIQVSEPAQADGQPVEAVSVAKPLWRRPLTRWVFCGAVLALALLVAIALRHDPLSDFRIQGRTLIAVDLKDRELWRYQFPWELNEQEYRNRERMMLSWIGDLNGDGDRELILVTRPYKEGTVGNTTFCFRRDGTVRWKFEAGRAVDDGGGSHLSPPYFTNTLQVLAGKTVANTRVIIGSAHYLEHAYQVAFLDVDGRVMGEYWHPGHLIHVEQADLDGSGRDDLLLAGVNNGNHEATLVVLDPLKIRGMMTPTEMKDRRFGLLNMPTSTEKAVIFFPRSCVSVGQPYTRAEALHVSKDRITVVTAEGTAERVNPGFIYELDYKLRVVSVTPNGMAVARAHSELEERGKLDHVFDPEKESALLKDGVVVRRGN